MTLIDRFLQVSIHWCPDAPWVRLATEGDAEEPRDADGSRFTLTA